MEYFEHRLLSIEQYITVVYVETSKIYKFVELTVVLLYYAAAVLGKT